MRAVDGEKRIEWRIECSWMYLVLESAVFGVGGRDREPSGVVSGTDGATNHGDGDGDGVGRIDPEDGEVHGFISSSIAGSGMVAYRGRVWDGGDEELVVLVVVHVFDVVNDCL